MSCAVPTLTNNKVKAKKQKGKQEDSQQRNVRTRYILDVIVKVNSDRDVITDDAPVCRLVHHSQHSIAAQYNTASNKQPLRRESYESRW